jgi:TrmH RNA methyltransferase
MARRRDAIVYGLHAALAVAEHRPESIRRVFFHRDRRVAVGPLLKACAHNRGPYREVPSEDLERLCGGSHHEGVVVFTYALPLLSIGQLLKRVGPSPLLIALDGVGNPHNLGAIIRSAAWFGADGVIFSGQPGQGTLNGATLRVAQGGAEVVPACGSTDLGPVLRAVARAGIAVLGADQSAPPDAWQEGPRRPVCLVLGNEGVGLSPTTRDALTGLIAIPGSGAVESLNVAVAAGVLMAKTR